MRTKRRRYYVSTVDLFKVYADERNLGKQIPPIYGYHPFMDLVLVSWKVYQKIRNG